MPLIDTHCHLDEPAFDANRDEILSRARNAGVVAIVSQGTTLESSRETVALADAHEMVYAAVGIHPNYAEAAAGTDWEHITRLVGSHPKIVAVGETGLDRYWDHTPFDVQVDYFRRHISLAREVGKPFIIHCREAEEEVVRELKTAADDGNGSVNAVMHSFCGSRETLDTCLELGLMISFAGMVTFKRNDELRKLAAAVPPERLLVETDAPYLSPEPKRGKRNEPAHVRHTAAVVAQAQNMTDSELGTLTTGNARRFFGIEE